MDVLLKVVQGPHTGREFAFREHDNFIVGRGSQAHFRLPAKDPYFSRIHFMVEVNPPYCRLVDMQSTNGTLVNSRRVTLTDLVDGDLIEGGDTIIRVSIAGADPPPHLDETATIPPRSASAGTVRNAPGSASDATGIQAGGAAGPPEPEGARLRPSQAVEAGDSQNEPTDCGAFEPTLVPGPAEGTSPDKRSGRIAQDRQRFAGYQIVEELGRGGMGVVYRAVRERDRAAVALKTVLPAVAASPADFERFLREAEILRELQHPSIVAFQEMGESDGTLFIVMDYVPGIDASKILRQSRHPFGIGQAVSLICQLLEALDYAHAKGFVHRDIKPANLLVVGDEPHQRLKLTDFGLARTYEMTRMSGLTMLGDIGGTTPFMPPEQITNYREAKPPVDQYSAAASLYRMLTRKHIFDFPAEVTRQFLMIMQDKPVPIQSRRPEIPAELAEVIHKALSRSPADRFPDVGKMRRALLPFATE